MIGIINIYDLWSTVTHFKHSSLYFSASLPPLCPTVAFRCAVGSAGNLHSLSAVESLVYLALASGNVKQTHLKNKLLPFSICNMLPSMTKVICLEI